MDTLIVYTAKYAFVISLVIAACVWLRLPSRQKTELLAWGALGGALAYILVKAAGALFYDTRPFVTDHTAPLFAHPADNGFPSDHTALTMFIAICVLRYSRRWGIVLIVISLLIGASRVAAGIHTPLDILGAVVIAVAAALITWPAAVWLNDRLRPPAGAGAEPPADAGG
jgi:undecaprenyl-diphosphatase